MKNHNLLLVIALLTVSFSVFGQEQQPKTVKKIRIHDIYVQAGSVSERNPTGTITDYRKLAPQSVLLSNDLTGYSSQPNSGRLSNFMFSVMLGIQFADKQKTTYKANPLLRLGFTYFSGINLNGNLNRSDTKTYDTTFNNPGVLYLDSTTQKSYGIQYSSQQLRLDGSLIFRTNPELRWSWFAGIGITAGLSINASTYIFYSRSVWSQSHSPNGTITSQSSIYSSQPGDWQTETFRNKTHFGLSSYIPMGIDFRIGKKREFWKRTHLFFELRPGINMTSIPELRTNTNANMQYGLGLKVSWD